MEKIVVNNAGKIIRDIRIYDKRTLKEFAVATEVHHTTLDMIELGKCNPTKRTLQKIADAYNLTMEQIIGQAPIVWSAI